MAELVRRIAPAAGEVPDLAELCRIHDLGLELIECSDDLDHLLDRVLEEYERRLAELPGDALDGRATERGADSQRKLRALVMFATQASALRAKALAADEIRRRADAVEAGNTRLNGVLAALQTGVLIVSADGIVRKANRAAAAMLCGDPEATCEGTRTPAFLDDAPHDAESEVVLARGPGGRTVLLVARRSLGPVDADEVVTLSDVTRRYAELEERHRLEKLADLLRTLGVLSHKINNPLTALLGRAQILRAKAETDPSVAKAAQVIEESAIRIADLIRELARVVKEGRQEAVDRVLDMQHGSEPDGGRP
ncbi:MAG TPA: histidine kinase dimerization/phospho-acceptor domain-containing protein [Candidatus Polarisedimenticolaceae bacterium]